MNLEIKILFLLTLTISVHQVFGQNTISKRKLCGKWDLDSFESTLKTGDTLLFKSDKNGNDTFLKQNGTLKRHTFYTHCGNKTFVDFFIRKPPDWETVGDWNLLTKDNKTILTMNIDNKILTFLLADYDNSNIRFILQSSTIRNYGRAL